MIEQAAEAQAEAEALAVAWARGQGGRDRHGAGGLASWSRRPGRLAAEGKILRARRSPLPSNPVASAPARGAPSLASISARPCAKRCRTAC